MFFNTPEPKQPYKRTECDDLSLQNSDRQVDSKTLVNDIMYHSITQMALNPKLDTLVFTTDANQILKVNIKLERPDEADKYEYLISSFHSKGILGLDVCIKKQIIATCATDRTVRIWSYTNNKFELDICQSYQEETYSLALHPSGFHIVIGFSESVRMMNILENQLVAFKNIQIKNCREISFSHGGQYFACQNAQNINVYKFYTGETSNDFFFKGHSNLIKSISWLEDDTGFVSCGWDSSVYLWKLYQDPKTDDNDTSLSRIVQPVWEYKLKNQTFNSVAVFRPEAGDNINPVVYACATDRTIREIKTLQGGTTDAPTFKAKESARYEEGIVYNQILTSYQRKFLIVGTSEQDKPATI